MKQKQKLALVFVETLKLKMGDKSNYWLSNESGISQSSLSRIFNGDVNPSLDTIEALAKALKVQPYELLKSTEEKKNIPADILEDLQGRPELVYDAIRSFLAAYSRGR